MLEGSQINQYHPTLKLFLEHKGSLLQSGIPLILYHCVLLFEHFQPDKLFKDPEIELKGPMGSGSVRRLWWGQGGSGRVRDV